jgi:hypothetical protein
MMTHHGDDNAVIGLSKQGVASFWRHGLDCSKTSVISKNADPEPGSDNRAPIENRGRLATGRTSRRSAS